MIQKCMSVLLCLILLAALVPNVGFAASGDEYHTVTFKAGDAEWTQSVLNETLVFQPENPVNTQGDEVFLGWYVTKGDELVPYNFKEIVTDDLELTAKFSDDHYLLIFEDGKGVALKVIEVLKNDIVSEDDIPVLTDLSIDKGVEYWYSDPADAVSSGVDFEKTLDFGENVVTLYPKISDRYVAVFVTNGTIVDPQTNFEPFVAEVPARPERVGYDFLYWVDKDGFPYDFDAEMNSGTEADRVTKIYAVWDPADVNYTVNFWNEKAGVDDPRTPDKTDGNYTAGNLDDYELVCTVLVEAGNQTYGAVSGSSVTFAADEADTLYLAGNNNAVNMVLNYSTMNYSETKEVAGSGETVINVYYQRNVYNLTFDLTKGYNNNTTVTSQGVEVEFKNGSKISTNDSVPDENLPDGVHYIAAGKFSIDIKLGQDVSEIWPTAITNNNTNLKYGSWGDYAGVHHGVISKGLINDLTHTGGNKYDNSTRTDNRSATYQMRWRTSAELPYTEERHYYIEALPDTDYSGSEVKQFTDTLFKETKDYVYHSSGAVINNQMTSPNPGAKGWPGKDIEGFVTITNSSVYNNKKMTISNYQTVEQDGNSKHYIITYYVPRLSYDMTLIFGDGLDQNSIGELEQNGFTVSGNSASKTLLYEEKLGEIPGITRDGYEFVGWYTDDELTQKFDGAIDGNETMPAHQVTLYAKYTGDTYTVTYYDGSDVVDAHQYMNGKYLTEHALENNAAYNNLNASDSRANTMDGKGTFLGWYYPLKVGKQTYMVEFPLDIAITEDYNLSARWDEEAYTVSYYYLDVETGTYGAGPDEIIGLTSGRNTLAKNGKDTPEQNETGYTFSGWNTADDGSGTLFTAATKVTADTNVYAALTVNDYTVTFINNLPEEAGNMPETLSGKHYNDAVTIDSAIPEIAGGEFVEWIDLDTGVTYQAGDVFEMPARNVTLTALWKFDGGIIGATDDLVSQSGSSPYGEAKVKENMVGVPDEDAGPAFPMSLDGLTSAANMISLTIGLLIVVAVAIALFVKRRENEN